MLLRLRTRGLSANPAHVPQHRARLTLVLEEDVVPDQRLVHALEVLVSDSGDGIRSFGALARQAGRAR